MSRVLARGLVLSLALHATALAGSLWLPRERELLPLFVDLTLSASPTGPTAPPGGAGAGREASAPPPRRLAAAERRAPAPTPGPPAAPPPVPAPPPAAEPPPPALVTAAPESSAALVIAPQPPAPAATTMPAGASTSAPPGASTPAPAASSGGAGTAASPGGGRDTGAGGFALASDAGGTSAGGGSGAGADMLALGLPGDDGGAYGAYVALLRRRVQEALTYPSAARRRGMSGTVHLDIAVEPTGRIGDVLVVRSSSHEMLDAAALEAVRGLRQVPFPPGVRPRPVRERLPVVFELR